MTSALSPTCFHRLKRLCLRAGAALALLDAGWAGAAEPGDPPGMYGAWWRGFPPREAGGVEKVAKLKAECPWMTGVFVALPWSELEPKPNQFDWKYFDETMSNYALGGLYIQLMVWVGPNSPRWIYENGVPEVHTTTTLNPHGQPHKDTYPFYLEPKYEEYYHRMIRAVAAHLPALPPKVREKLICLQTAEGTTGDEGGYKGEPLDKRYVLPEEKWVAFKEKTWRLFDELYRDQKPKIHLLINSGNQGQYHDWLMKNMPDTWRKAGNPGHGYQLNNELEMIAFLDPIINHRNSNGNFIRCRSEMDETFKGWFKEAPVWNQYWLNLWGLHFGIDIQQNETSAFLDHRNDEGFRFYAQYGGEKDPATSPGAWCALRDGLDAADHQRFPDAEFGPGQLEPRIASPEAMARAVKIAASLASYGAKQGDPDKGVRLIMQNRDAKSMNDVGYGIWPGNYQRYLTQLDPNGTSQGYWRVGDPLQPYGRFARGFDVATKRNTLSFALDDHFFAQTPAGGHAVKVRVIYFDQGHGAWALKYDAVSAPEKSALEVKNTDSGRWKEATVTLTDANLKHRGPHQADLELVNMSAENTLFHLVEVLRQP